MARTCRRSVRVPGDVEEQGRDGTVAGGRRLVAGVRECGRACAGGVAGNNDNWEEGDGRAPADRRVAESF